MSNKPEKLTVRQFFDRFPTDDACLEHVMVVRYGLRHVCQHCKTESTFHKLTERRAYSCAHCGAHVYPCAGTIFQDSRTSLQTWFYAIYLFVVTRHGVSGKELERALGVTYKTAWRMGQQIRALMISADGLYRLQGHVEADEAYIGGRRKAGVHFRGRGAKGKTIVFGMKERGGRMIADVVPDVTTASLRGKVLRNIEPGSIVSTDELGSYFLLEGDGYKHGRVKHAAKQYAKFDPELGVVHHVNSVESFWKLFKASIRSTHIHVSPEYMERYLGEFTFRANHRVMRNAMFDLLIASI
jgi:transposase-like protein